MTRCLRQLPQNPQRFLQGGVKRREETSTCSDKNVGSSRPPEVNGGSGKRQSHGTIARSISSLSNPPVISPEYLRISTLREVASLPHRAAMDVRRMRYPHIHGIGLGRSGSRLSATPVTSAQPSKARRLARPKYQHPARISQFSFEVRSAFACTLCIASWSLSVLTSL